MTDYLINSSFKRICATLQQRACGTLGYCSTSYVAQQLYNWPHATLWAPYKNRCSTWRHLLSVQSEFAKWICKVNYKPLFRQRPLQETGAVHLLLQHYVPQQLYNWVIKLTSSNFMNPIQIQPLHMKAPVISTKWICKVNYKPLFRQRPLQETGTVHLLLQHYVSQQLY